MVIIVCIQKNLESREEIKSKRYHISEVENSFFHSGRKTFYKFEQKMFLVKSSRKVP
jgi:hypothetical protein